MDSLLVDEATYAAGIASFKHVYITQSPQWAQVKANWQVDRLRAENADGQVAYAQMLSIAGPAPLSYIPRGPVSAINPPPTCSLI